MSSTESRFMRIKRYSEQEVGRLHDTERSSGSNWLITGAAVMDSLDLDKGAYWPKTMAIEDRDRSVASFMAHSCVRRAFAMLTDYGKTEAQAMHDADWVVWKEAPNPTTTKAESQLANLYRKSE